MTAVHRITIQHVYKWCLYHESKLSEKDERGSQTVRETDMGLGCLLLFADDSAARLIGRTSRLLSEGDSERVEVRAIEGGY